MATSCLKLAVSAVAAALAFSFTLTSPSNVAGAQEMVVKYDQSQIIRLERAVNEIIIGNPTVVEVTVHNPKMLIVTGKTFGITNVIMLDAERQVISEQRMIVVRDNARRVSLHKGTKQHTYNCTPQCAPAIMIGDDPTFFETARNMAERKMRFSEQGADRDASSGQQPPGQQ